MTESFNNGSSLSTCGTELGHPDHRRSQVGEALRCRVLHCINRHNGLLEARPSDKRPPCLHCTPVSRAPLLVGYISHAQLCTTSMLYTLVTLPYIDDIGTEKHDRAQLQPIQHHAQGRCQRTSKPSDLCAMLIDKPPRVLLSRKKIFLVGKQFGLATKPGKKRQEGQCQRLWNS